MLADNGKGCAQSESRTALLGGEVRVEYFTKVIFFYAIASILKDDSYI